MKTTNHIVLDRPWGYAAATLANYKLHNVLIASDNPCPEYQLDLLAAEPVALVTHVTGDAIVRTLYCLEKANYHHPTFDTTLTSAERKILRLVAKGLSNKQIAKMLDINNGTVHNHLRRVYNKLGLKSRVQAALYYLGNWHVLENWQAPAHST